LWPLLPNSKTKRGFHAKIRTSFLLNPSFPNSRTKTTDEAMPMLTEATLKAAIVGERK